MDPSAIDHSNLPQQHVGLNGPNLHSIGDDISDQNPDPSSVPPPGMFRNVHNLNISGGVLTSISGDQFDSTAGDVRLDLRNAHMSVRQRRIPIFRTTSPPAKSRADIEAMLDEKVAAQGRRLLWRESIADLFETLQLEYSLSRDRKLAGELGYDSDILSEDTAKMDMWLHTWVMVQLVESGGEIPAALKTSGTFNDTGDDHSTMDVQCDFQVTNTALGSEGSLQEN